MARPSPLDIYALLDKSNCKDCGLDTCMAFATDLLERKVRVEDCTHLMNDPKQAKNRNKLITLVTPPQKPVILGVGDRQCVIGGEEVMFRHQLTYYNPTAIFIEIEDDDPDIEQTAKYLTELKVERIGDVLTLDGIALRCVSGNSDQFKLAAKKLTEVSNLPVMLCSLDPDILLGAAGLLREEMGTPVTGRSWDIPYSRAIEAIQEKLDEAAFNAAWEEGRKMTLDEAVEYALGED